MKEILSFIILIVLWFVTIGVMDLPIAQNLKLEKNFLVSLIVIGPGIIALVITYVYRGREGIKDIFATNIAARTFLKFLAIILISPILINTILQYLYIWYFYFHNRSIHLPEISFFKLILLNTLVVFNNIYPHFFYNTIKYAVFEEIALRGFLLKKIQRLNGHFGKLMGGVIVGIFWSISQIYAIYLYDQSIDFKAIFEIGIYTVSTSVIYSWLYYKTSGNIFLCIFLNSYSMALFNIRGISEEVGWVLAPAIIPSVETLYNYNGVYYNKYDLVVNLIVCVLPVLSFKNSLNAKIKLLPWK